MRRSIYCIGTRLRECRIKKHLTQKELANRIGTSSKYLSHVETGVKFPSLEMLVCLARELDVSLDHMIGSDLSAERNTSTEEIQRLLSECSPGESDFISEVIVSIRSGMEKRGIIVTRKR